MNRNGGGLRWPAVAALAALAACAAPGSSARLAVAADALAANPDLAGGRVGLHVVDAATGAVVLARDADRGFPPASNAKLLSCAAALGSLGPQRTLATELIARGEVHDGVLDGDLVVRGHGDPTFGAGDGLRDATRTFLAGLRDAGIRRVHGRVVGDGGWLPDEHLGRGWQWDYLDEDYAAPFGGLCHAGNVTTLRIRPGPAGPVVEVSTLAGVLPHVAIRQGPAGSPTELVAHRALGREEVVVTGTLAADAQEQVLRVPVPDPARSAAAAVAAALTAAGLSIDGADLASAGVERLVASHASPPVSVILQDTLRRSDNLGAEQLWRVAAKHAGGDGGSASAERHAAEVLAGLGVPVQGLVLADGSGLSRRNLVQPRQLTSLLLAMHRSPLREVFVSGLPVAGRSGTLGNRFPAGPAREHVFAKTGTIDRVACLSGYVVRPDPAAPPLVFSVMLADFVCDGDRAKAAIDAFVQELAAAAGW